MSHSNRKPALLACRVAKLCGLAALGAMLTVGAGAQAQAQSIATPVAPAGGAAGGSLPGGASSLTETHEDWTVGCQVKDSGKECIFSQSLGNKQTGRRVLSLELQPKADGSAQGVILAPFGLRLNDGVTLKVDEKPIGEKLPFTTCMEAGCLVPVTFTTEMLSTVGSGEQMSFNALNGASGEPVVLTLSLKGFTAARNRVAELMK